MPIRKPWLTPSLTRTGGVGGAASGYNVILDLRGVSANVGQGFTGPLNYASTSYTIRGISTNAFLSFTRAPAPTSVVFAADSISPLQYWFQGTRTSGSTSAPFVATRNNTVGAGNGILSNVTVSCKFIVDQLSATTLWTFGSSSRGMAAGFGANGALGINLRPNFNMGVGTITTNTLYSLVVTREQDPILTTTYTTTAYLNNVLASQTTAGMTGIGPGDSFSVMGNYTATNDGLVGKMTDFVLISGSVTVIAQFPGADAASMGGAPFL